MYAHHRRKTIAHVLPLALLLGLQFLIPLIKIENPELPWWRHSPEHWLYPLQTILCLALLLIFRSEYRFGKPRFLGLAIFTGLIGIAIWIAPVLLGWQDRSTDGYDPTLLDWQTYPIGSWSLLAVRFFRLVIIVPFVEEIFWRGFLMRWLIDSPKPWHEIPIGTYSHRAFWITVAMVGLAHFGADLGVALIWGTLIGFVTVKVKNLWAPILAHAVANLALGVFIMKTESWGLW